MTQIESIQMQIHFTKIELIAARKNSPSDEITKLHKIASVEYYLNELKELKFCLKCAIKQLS